MSEDEVEMTQAVKELVDEVTVLGAPPGVHLVPEEIRDDLMWWQLVYSVLVGAKQQGYLALGPPQDVVWTYCGTVEEVRAVQLRHDCQGCADALEVAARSIEMGHHGTIAVVQFGQHYLRKAGDPPSPFASKQHHEH